MPHAGGRPTDYTPELVDKVKEYLNIRKDEVVQVLKYSGKDGESYEEKIKVNLPTIEGLATYIGCDKSTLYEWAEIHEEFSHALELVRREQHDRLVDNGLSGNYNSTIAKLILSSNHGYVERRDHTSDGKQINPQPIADVRPDNRIPQNKEPDQEN